MNLTLGSTMALLCSNIENMRLNFYVFYILFLYKYFHHMYVMPVEAKRGRGIPGT